jgi:hypothetical protein
MQQIELVGKILEKTGPVSPAYLQRKLKITFEHAQKIIDWIKANKEVKND